MPNVRQTQACCACLATPVVVVAQDDLHRVLPNRLGDVAERRHGHVAGRRRVDAIRHKPAPDLCIPSVHAGILEVAATESSSASPARLSPMCRQTKRNSDQCEAAPLAKRLAKLANGFHFNVGLQNAALKLDGAENLLSRI